MGTAKFVRYLVISFSGKTRAYEKYLKLQALVFEAIDHLALMGDAHNATELTLWARGPSGFTRPNTPYYVTMTVDEWKILVRGLRRDGKNTAAYQWVRSYADWCAVEAESAEPGGFFYRTMRA